MDTLPATCLTATVTVPEGDPHRRGGDRFFVADSAQQSRGADDGHGVGAAGSLEGRAGHRIHVLVATCAVKCAVSSK